VCECSVHRILHLETFVPHRECSLPSQLGHVSNRVSGLQHRKPASAENLASCMYMVPHPLRFERSAKHYKNKTRHICLNRGGGEGGMYPFQEVDRLVLICMHTGIFARQGICLKHSGKYILIMSTQFISAWLTV
jgi:hypothetical protein